MSYKPKSEQQSSNSYVPKPAKNGKPWLNPVPEEGSQAARIGLIVDIGTQHREDFEDQKTKEIKPQDPCQQLVVYADLVDQVVDYGGDAGEQQYRLLVNHSFKGDIRGINFNASPPRDGDANIIDGKIWTFHPQNLMTKLAKASGNDQILGDNEEDNMDISQLLDAALYVDVEVTKKAHKTKKDEGGNPVVNTYVNYKSCSKPPKVGGKIVDVAPLTCTPMIISHDNVTEDTLCFIQTRVMKMMKAAAEYNGSKLQALNGEEKVEAPAKGEESSTPEPSPEVTEQAKF